MGAPWTSGQVAEKLILPYAQYLLLSGPPLSWDIPMPKDEPLLLLPEKLLLSCCTAAFWYKWSCH